MTTRPDRPLPNPADKRPWGSLSNRQQEDRIRIAFAKARMARGNGSRKRHADPITNGSDSTPGAPS